MNELCITIHNVTDTDHEALIRHIKRTLYDYDPELQVTIPESSFGFPPGKDIPGSITLNVTLLKQRAGICSSTVQTRSSEKRAGSANC